MTGLPDLASAMEWARKHWAEQRPVPTRLHERLLGDDGAPRFSPAFFAYISGGEWAYSWVDIHDVCRLCRYGEPSPDCRVCQGRVDYTYSRKAWSYPMGAALARLAKERKPTAPTWPAPVVLVYLLAINGWEPARASAALGKPVLGPDHYKTIEAAFLLALRELGKRYTEWAPEKQSSRPKSESQAIAEHGGLDTAA